MRRRSEPSRYDEWIVYTNSIDIEVDLKVLKLGMAKRNIKDSLKHVFDYSYPHNDKGITEFTIDELIKHVGIDTVKEIVKKKRKL